MLYIRQNCSCLVVSSSKGSEKERGIKSWRKKVQENGAGDAVNQSCYDIPYCNAVFQRFKCFQYLPFLPSYREPRRKASK